EQGVLHEPLGVGRAEVHTAVADVGPPLIAYRPRCPVDVLPRVGDSHIAVGGGPVVPGLAGGGVRGDHHGDRLAGHREMNPVCRVVPHHTATPRTGREVLDELSVPFDGHPEGLRVHLADLRAPDLEVPDV